MEIDEVKSNWQSAKNNIRQDLGPHSGKNKTALQRLGDKYCRFSIMSLIIMFIGPNVLFNAGIRSVWFIAGYFILLGAASVIDRYLANSIRAIDPAHMSVTEVLERTMKCRRIHVRFVAIAAPFAIFWCAGAAYIMQANIYIFYGICTGGFVGLIVGINVLMNFLNDYREAMQE